MAGGVILFDNTGKPLLVGAHPAAQSLAVTIAADQPPIQVVVGAGGSAVAGLNLIDARNVPGVVNDGATNNTAAFQAVLDSGAYSGIFFPPGTVWRVSGLKPHSGNWFVGANSDYSGLKLTQNQKSQISMPNSAPLLADGSLGAIFYDADNLNAAAAVNVTIMDLEIDGNHGNQVHAANKGLVHIGDGDGSVEAHWKIYRCNIINAGADGSGGSITAAGGNGVYIGNNRRACLVTDGTSLSNNLASGIQVLGTDNTIFACQLGANGTNGAYIQNTTNRLIACDIYGNTTNGILIDNAAIDVQITNNSLDRNGTNGIYTAHAQNSCTITGNTFHSNSATTNGGASDVRSAQTVDGALRMANNIFSALDGGFTNKVNYRIRNDGNVPIAGNGNVDTSPTAAVFAFSSTPAHHRGSDWTGNGTLNVTAFASATQANISQTNYAFLPTGMVRVSSAGATNAVTLPPALEGATITIFNTSGNTLTIFPAPTDTVAGLAHDASTTLANGSHITYICQTRYTGVNGGGNWVVL